jgi:hypothetical protein
MFGIYGWGEVEEINLNSCSKSVQEGIGDNAF